MRTERSGHVGDRLHGQDPGLAARLDYDHPEMLSGMFVPSLSGEQIGGNDGDFVIVEWSDSGDGTWEWIAPLHVHHADDEAWYILEGTLRFQIGSETFEAGAGGAVLAPKGTPHAYGNARRGERARYLLVITPKIRALVNALHQPRAGDYAAIFRAHDSELLS